MLVQILRLLIMVILALGIGKLVSKLKLPSILGWLITGMVFGPHAFAVMNQETLDAGWYQIVVHVLECAVGLMIGTELVWNKIKRSGKSQHLRSHWEHFLLSRWYSAWYSIYRIFWSIWRLFLEESRWRLRRRRHYRSSESLTQKDRLPEH